MYGGQPGFINSSSGQQCFLNDNKNISSKMVSQANEIFLEKKNDLEHKHSVTFVIKVGTTSNESRKIEN